MIPWVQIYSNLPRHPKVGRLADALGLSCAAVGVDQVTVGLLVSLWSWAMQNAANGDLSNVSDRTIAEACGWRRKPETLVKALLACGWMDEDRRLHDWDDYTLMYQDLAADTREKARDRQRKRREKLKADSVTQA